MTQTTLAATETTRVTGTFKTLGWEEKPYDEAADMPKLIARRGVRRVGRRHRR